MVWLLLATELVGVAAAPEGYRGNRTLRETRVGLGTTTSLPFRPSLGGPADDNLCEEDDDGFVSLL